MLMSDSNSHNSDNKPGFVRRAAGKIGRGTVKVADYTLLPIRELRTLKSMVGVSWRMLKDMMIFSWAVIRANGKDMASSDFYKKIFRRKGIDHYTKSLSAEERVKLADMLSPAFFTKRLVAISSVFVVFLLTAAAFMVGVLWGSPSYFRLIVSFFVMCFVGMYLWVSMRHYERLRAFYEQCDHLDIKAEGAKHQLKTAKGSGSKKIKVLNE